MGRDVRRTLDALIVQRVEDNQRVRHVNCAYSRRITNSGAAVDQHVIVSRLHLADALVEECPPAEFPIEFVPIEGVHPRPI